MAIMDRYLLWRFLKIFVISSGSLIGLYILVDAFKDLEEFLGYAREEGGGTVGLFSVLGAYYGPRTLALFDRISPLLAVIAAIFSITLMQRSNELTAILAAGVAKARVVRPLIVAALLVSALAVANREFLLPRFQDALSRNAQNWKGRQGQPLNPRWDTRTDILIDGQFTFAAQQRISSPRFALPKSYRAFSRELTAENAYYKPPTAERPGGYLLQDVAQPAKIRTLPSVTSGNQTIIYTPFDTPWLEPDQCFLASNVDFEQIAAGKAWRQYSSTASLLTAIRNPSLNYGADVKVAIHSRILRPILDMSLFFIGLGIVLTRHERNMFLAAGQCLVAVAIFFIVVWGLEAIGNTGTLMSPAFAAWAPLMIWVPTAVLSSQRLHQ